MMVLVDAPVVLSSTNVPVRHSGSTAAGAGRDAGWGEQGRSKLQAPRAGHAHACMLPNPKRLTDGAADDGDRREQLDAQHQEASDDLQWTVVQCKGGVV